MEHVKKLLESADPQIRIVECLPTPDAAAKNGTDRNIAPRDPNNPDEPSSTDRE